MPDPLLFYIEQVSALDAKVKALRKKSNQVGSLRGVLAIAALGSIYFGVRNPMYFVLTFFLVSGFLFLVKKSSLIADALEKAKVLLKLNENELRFIKGDKSVFDTGDDVDIKDHLFALDLDLFGKGSLFQSIGRTCTSGGRHLLIHTLLYPLSVIEKIQERQQAVDDLKSRVGFRQQFYCLGKLSGEKSDDTRELEEWTTIKDFFSGRNHWLFIAGFFTLASCILILVMLIKVTFYPGFLLLLFLVNSSILFFFSKESKIYFDAFGKRTLFFGKVSAIFDLVAGEKFDDGICSSLGSNAKTASTAFVSLSKIAHLADQRLNGIMGPFLNIFFFFDIWNIYKIEAWRKKYRDDVPEWIESLSEMDMLGSLANFAFNHPGFSKAKIKNESGLIIDAKRLGHPLITDSISVRNDYAIGPGTRAHIITGSNMAGKSTFIRSVGVNMILALNGVPVCATEFSCSVMQIVSCIRITDSLEENASYFKAELNRLGRIVAVLKTGEPCLVLLDEILRGTNSEDKRHGTIAFFKKFKGYNCVALLATHDLNVGQLGKDDPEYFENFCFESVVKDSELIFDYKLRPGISGSANATFLMEKMGLI